MKLNNAMRLIFNIFICAALGLTVMVAMAGELAFTQRPEIQQFISLMVKRHHFQEAELSQIFNQVNKRQKIIDAITRPAESKPWYQYRPIFITQKRIQGGIDFRSKYAQTLQRAEETYGVPGEIITAILGVETYYGKHKGSYKVMDALTTLAFDYPKRSKFFLGELEHFLLLAREENLEPLSIKGSYAGAMGYPQFISSSFRHYAVDFSGDSRRDIWKNVDDAIGSVANYLSRHGWQRDQGIAFPALVTGDAYETYLDKGIKPHTAIGQFRENGVSISAQLPAAQKGSLIVLEDRSQPEYWVGLNNFYVITRYNHSPLYAMAVYQLSEEIRRQSGQETASLQAE